MSLQNEREQKYIVFQSSIHIMVIINTTETCSIAWTKESLHSYVLIVPITSREGIEFINHSDGSTLRVSRKRSPSRAKVENQKISFFHVLVNHKIDSKSHELSISAKMVQNEVYVGGAWETRSFYIPLDFSSCRRLIFLVDILPVDLTSITWVKFDFRRKVNDYVFCRDVNPEICNVHITIRHKANLHLHTNVTEQTWWQLIWAKRKTSTYALFTFGYAVLRWWMLSCWLASNNAIWNTVWCEQFSKKPFQVRGFAYWTPTSYTGSLMPSEM